MLTPRDYQRRALDAIHEAAARGLLRIMLVLPTAAGKTVVFAHLLRERGGRAVVLAHRDELVRQAADKIRMIYPEARVGIVKADEDEVHADIVVASVQTLARPRRLERLVATTRSVFGPQRINTVVCDEAHHATAETYMQVFRGLGCMDEGGPLTLGVTATPERTDDKGLGEMFQEVVFQLSILDGIRGGWLCDLRAKQIKLACDFNGLRMRAGEIRDDESESMLMEADAPGHAARAYLQHASGMKAVVFTPTVAVAHAMAAAFNAAGVSAEAIDGEMALDDRRAILRRLATGETLVVANCAVLTEGWDEPSCQVAIMARPTRSRPFAIQCIGRILRPYPGKTHALVLDLVGSATRMDLVTVASLFDVGQEAAEQGVFEATAKAEQLHAAQPALPSDGRLVSVDVELFKGRDFAWVDAGGRFILSLGAEGSVVLEMVGPDLWDVVQSKRVTVPGSRWPTNERKRLYAGLSMGYAQGVAEDLVRRHKAVGLNAKDATWRKAEPSAAQIALLKKRKRWRDGLSKGEASDLITAMFATGGRRA